MKKRKIGAKLVNAMSKKHYVTLVLAVAAVAVGHFLTQMSFIGKQNAALVKELGEIVPAVEKQSFDVARIPEIIADSKPDALINSQASRVEREVPMVRVSQRAERPRIVAEPKPASPKKDVQRQAEKSRLRRAEKLLTGF